MAISTGCSPKGVLTSLIGSPRRTAFAGKSRAASNIRYANGKPLSPGPYGTPCVWFERDRWYLFYERGDRGIWLASSADGRRWTNVEDEPVIRMGPEPYDKYAVALNQVVKYRGKYYGYYHGNADRLHHGRGPRAWPCRPTWCTGRSMRRIRSFAPITPARFSSTMAASAGSTRCIRTFGRGFPADRPSESSPRGRADVLRDAMAFGH